MDYILLGIVWYIILLISLTFHEASHSFAAMKLGDRTAYHQGQVSLDPVVHIKREPFGTVILPIISYALSGWMIGWASAPYDPYWAQRNRKKAAIMSLAGPAANLFLLITAALIIRCGMIFGIFYAPESIIFTRVTSATSTGLGNSAAICVSILFSLNLILFIFNLIPLPPLDGSNVLMFFLNDTTARQYENFLYQPMYRIIGLVIAWQIFGHIFSPIHLLAINLLYPGAGYH